MLSQYSLHSLFWEFASIHQMLQKVETTLEYHIDLSQQNLLNVDLIFYFLQNFMFAWLFPTMPTASCCKFIVVLTWDGNSHYLFIVHLLIYLSQKRQLLISTSDIFQYNICLLSIKSVLPVGSVRYYENAIKVCWQISGVKNPANYWYTLRVIYYSHYISKWKFVNFHNNRSTNNGF